MRLFRYYYGKEGLQIVPRSPAIGKEKRFITGSKSPDSSLASKRISRNAKLLRSAKRGDEDNYLELLRSLTNNIQLYALQNRWHVDSYGARAESLAIAALSAYMFNGGVRESDAKTARIMCITKSTYQKSWKARLEIIMSWVKSWSEE